ncbi:transmembrane protein 221 [Motacilla alba alba]|uniref:transmembrane protein 221 n=1 Tax=Motacilla alba alba TaxID=1094192 RepID=UPI0018D510E9|nr:transmembrane protein 221 [Motacilla alba alba]
MPSPYPRQALMVLLLFGTLSAAMALLSSSLIFQLPSGRAAPGAAAGALPEPVAAALLPVAAALAALCLVLNVSCLLLCLLHGYLSTELCRGQPGPERAAWFLLDSRSVRHAAIGLFCCGVCLYLTALALSMLLLFQPEAGIAGACILASGILVLLISLLHALLRASRISRGSELSRALYENDSGSERSAAPPRPRPEIHREFSLPPFLEGKSQPGSASSSNLSSRSREFHRESQQELSRSKEIPRESQSQDWSRSGEFLRESQQELSRSREFPRESQEFSRSREFPRGSQDWSRSGEFLRESQQELSRSKEIPVKSQSQDWSRTHRTLLDSGLLQEQGKPWNVPSREMRNVLSHRATKDSTLV